MRDSLTALAALVAIALLALMVGPHFVDWDSQRLRVAAAIEARTGVAVRFSGPLRVTLLPTPELDAETIEVGPPEAPVARAERLTVSLSPLALISGRLTFNTARADRVLVSRPALRTLRAGTAPGLDEDWIGQIGFDLLDLKGVRFVERLETGMPAPTGTGALDIALEAPSLLGPFRLQVQDPATGRDFRAQIGKLEKGRARLKGVLEDRGLAARVSLDGWFGMPDVSGRPLFDGAATFSGNPSLTGKDGGQLAYQGTARIIAHLDQTIADPINLAFGSGDGAFQLAGQGFLDLKGARPALQIKLGAKRYDATAHFGAEDGARKPGQVNPEQTGRAPSAMAQNAIAVLGQMALPIDIVADLSVGAIQVPGGTLQDVQLKAAVRSGGLVVETFAAGLPGGTKATFTRAAAPESVPVDGRLEVDSSELQTLVSWIRGADGAANLPASARLSARLVGGVTGLKIPDVQIESTAGTLLGSGDLLPPEAGKRISPKMTLDLAAERFDARVLAALDPLRPIPGLELATRLSVKRLALDGQDMGGLQVALDRDGAIATLRQLRLTGRKGEEVTLSGTASGDGLQMTAKLDAERLGDIAQLGNALLPGPMTEAFLKRAGQLEPAIAVANLRLMTRAGDATWDVAVDGRLGGTAVVGRSQSTLKGNDLSVSLEADVSNADGGRLAAQVFGLAMPATAIPGRLTLKAEGNPRRLVSGTLTGTMAGVELGFEGGLNPFRSTPLEGRITLASRNLAVLGAAMGSTKSFRDGVSGRLAGRLVADRSKVLVTGLDAAIGDDPVSGEIAFDLVRGGQVAGQIRLGSVALAPILAPVFGTSWPQAAAGWSGEGFAPPVPPLAAGDLWIEARTLSLAEGWTLDQPQFVLRFAPGSVAVENFEAKAGEARVAGSVTFSRRDSRVDLGGRLEFARLPLAALKGRLSGEIPMTGGGASPRELIASLSGAGKVTLDEMAVADADPQALARVVTRPLDDLAPINENRIGGLIDQELRKGELRLSGLAAPLGLINGQVRVAVPPRVLEQAGGMTVSVTPNFSVDLLRREAEARFIFAQTVLPRDWSGAVPEIQLALPLEARAPGEGRPGESKPQRRLQVASLVNGFLAMAIQRDLERAEAFEADVRERAAHLRRQRGDAFIERRNREIREAEAAIEAEAAAIRRRAEREKADREAAELAATLKALETKARETKAPEVPRPAAVGAPLELVPRVSPTIPPAATPPAAPPG
ncbi:MAG: hypothetical protein FD175_109 [Beijerinckiaceae bacterium]|nr:MAG: hypothetical protein FD175_109 [Beijerinckiaceae bacterium]